MKNEQLGSCGNNCHPHNKAFHSQMSMFMSMFLRLNLDSALFGLTTDVCDKLFCSISKKKKTSKFKNIKLYMNVHFYQADRGNPSLLCSVISLKALTIISYSEITVFFPLHVDDMNQ